jgi:integrase
MSQKASMNAPSPAIVTAAQAILSNRRSAPQNALAILAGHAGDDLYAANLRKDAESSRGTRSANTERALLGDVLLFSAWCLDAGLRHLPATAETVAAFIDAQAALGKAPASVRRYAASIAAYHRSAQAPNPMELKIATDGLKRMGRAQGEKQRQAKGINDNLVVRMLQAAGKTRLDLRNKALLAVAYTTLCRRSELVALLVEDLNADADGFGTIIVRKSKTDQTGKGASVAITADAMHHLRAWLTAASIESGPLFRSVNRHGRVGGPLDQGSIAVIFKAMAERVRNPRLGAADIAQISAHSTRVGACQDMVRYGADIAGAMQAGRWQTTTMVSRYCEGLELKRGAVAQVAARREQFV